jgi:DNA-binding beta-propeller fold protein YncE
MSAVALIAVPAASAANMIFWTTPYAANQVYVANLDGSSTGPAALNATGGTVNTPWGIAVDSVAGRAYWANYLGNKISFARLNGTGGGDLDTGTATVSGPIGPVVDQVGGRIYWANSNGNKISFARLDGGGGGDLNTGTATVSNPEGVAIDTREGKIYWPNYGADKISFAKLDGSGGGDLNVIGTTNSQPWGIVIDSLLRRALWGNFQVNALDYANLDGTGGATFSTTGAAQLAPMPGSIDHAGGKIYWSNWTAPNGIMFASADGSGSGGTLYPTSAQTAMPTVLKAPVAAGAPTIAATDSTAPATLSCPQGAWAADLLGERLYRAPGSFSYQWRLGGADIAGAQQSTISVTSGGVYQCLVTASNAAGSASQASPPVTVLAPPPPASTAPDTKITKAKINPAKGSATFKFKATAGKATGFQCQLKRSAQRKKARFKSCKSPKAYKDLKAGKYVFQVRAIGAGSADPTPAKRTFRIG